MANTSLPVTIKQEPDDIQGPQLQTSQGHNIETSQGW